jgi:uncharacterized membrane protein YqjE
MFRIVGAAIMAATMIALLVLIALGIWSDPLTALKVVMVIIGITGTILGIAVLVDHIQSRPAKDTDYEPKSMMAMKYYSFKNKICPMIEFKSPKK